MVASAPESKGREDEETTPTIRSVRGDSEDMDAQQFGFLLGHAIRDQVVQNRMAWVNA
jgi:hypothetical protein